MIKDWKNYVDKKTDPLHKYDTSTQTYGCRKYNPDICKDAGGDNCALYNESRICSTPSARWAKIYEQLKNTHK